MEHENIRKEARQKRVLKYLPVSILATLLFLLVSACSGAVTTSPTSKPTDIPSTMPGMDMGNVAQPTAMPSTMPGMDMGGAAQQPTAMPGMGSGLMQDEPIPSEGAVPATETQGGQLLPYTLDGDVKVFELTAKPMLWKINADTQVTALTYNGTVPGPLIRVTEGDKVRVIFKNTLTTPTSIHWHGMPVPTNMDGVSQPELSQTPVKPGETYTYEFVAKPAGTYMYHSHYDTDTQINPGLFGGFIVEPKNWAAVKPDVDVTLILNEWRVIDGVTYPAMPSMGEPNFFTINGKTYPDIPTINVKQGQRVRLRFVGAGQFEHPMHLHGASFKIVATDGNPVPEIAQLTKDTLPVHPGERFDIEFVADNPGQWAVHCHIVHHTTNNDVEPGGLLFVVNVQP
ncbi:MAG: multicopper oxidase domain-containing protein [Chloroflexi bacterium]|nr:multicopper oxidase domain-containing protein [Chloroflexota bacterium]MBI3339215.1 multicopper oxidase domain-containing protein [Chloroflexota bacterium]